MSREKYGPENASRMSRRRLKRELHLNRLEGMRDVAASAGLALVFALLASMSPAALPQFVPFSASLLWLFWLPTGYFLLDAVVTVFWHVSVAKPLRGELRRRGPETKPVSVNFTKEDDVDLSGFPWWKELSDRDLRYCLRRGYWKLTRDVLISTGFFCGIVATIAYHIDTFIPVSVMWAVAVLMLCVIVADIANFVWMVRPIRREYKLRKQAHA